MEDSHERLQILCLKPRVQFVAWMSENICSSFQECYWICRFFLQELTLDCFSMIKPDAWSEPAWATAVVCCYKCYKNVVTAQKSQSSLSNSHVLKIRSQFPQNQYCMLTIISQKHCCKTVGCMLKCNMVSQIFASDIWEHVYCQSEGHLVASKTCL